MESSEPNRRSRAPVCAPCEDLLPAPTVKCVFATGATAAIGKNRVNYSCGTGKDSLRGTPARKSEPSTIYIAPDSAKKLTQKVAIKTPWF